jgi:hypothetical protein
VAQLYPQALGSTHSTNCLSLSQRIIISCPKPLQHSVFSTHHKASCFKFSPQFLEVCLRVFENRVLTRIFGPKKDKVTGGWRKLHNEELHNFYSSPSIIRIIKSRMRWTGIVARIWEKRNAYRLLVSKTEGKIPLGRPKHR